LPAETVSSPTFQTSGRSSTTTAGDASRRRIDRRATATESKGDANLCKRFGQRRALALRDNFTAYDAFYVALAESLGMPLLTDDRKYAKSAGHTAAIETLA